MIPRIVRIALIACLLAPLGLPAAASPRDAQPGDVRAVFRREGTTLREQAGVMARPVATLASGTQVRVLQVNLPWLEVATVEPAGQPPRRGWLKALETVEPEALRPNPRPAPVALRGGGVDARDASAAGRQLTASTESAYVASQPQLRAAYAKVDAMEAATRAMDPAASVAFILDGRLSRVGQDYARPALLPPTSATTSAPSRGGSGAGGLLGRLGGEALERFGPGGRAGDALRAASQALGGYVDQLRKAFTPVQEYYLGRAVAANAIARHGVDPDEARRHYVRQVGDAIVRLSGRVPSNHGGYHFEVLDTDEINGISGPGGYVLLTRGAVESCATEDELAALIAHELAHVTRKHAEGILRESGKTEAMLSGLVRVGGAASGLDDAAVAREMLGFFSQAVGEMSRTAAEHGYGRQLEIAADTEGTYLLFDVFYDHGALRAWLARQGASGDVHGGATHASPQARAQALEPIVGRYGPFPDRGDILAMRQARFRERLGHAGAR